VALYSGYTISQLNSLRRLQIETIDRNRADSLLLLRIQNDLNALALTMRDMLDSTEPYPLTAWHGQFQRIRGDLEDALTRETHFSPASRTADQQAYLASSFSQFWNGVNRVFQLAQASQETEARTQIQLSLQARQATLGTAVARLLIQNNESEMQVSGETAGIYARVEQNVYIFLGAMLVVVVSTGLYLIYFNRTMFRRVTTLAGQRSELAQQLISIQENTFRYISRELHDEFGQILTAIGAMLQRVDRRAAVAESPLRPDLEEVRGIVQSTLEKVRALSQALHPVILDEAGLEAALKAHVSAFQKQTSIEIQYQIRGDSRVVDSRVAIHLYRVLQEALNNVARHSKATHADVRLHYLADSIVLEVEDDGEGFDAAGRVSGMGFTSMRERAELIDGQLELVRAHTGGALVRLTAPLGPEDADAET
jgi:signal transduction histidine kinase